MSFYIIPNYIIKFNELAKMLFATHCSLKIKARYYLGLVKQPVSYKMQKEKNSYFENFQHTNIKFCQYIHSFQCLKKYVPVKTKISLSKYDRYIAFCCRNIMFVLNRF